MEDIKDHRRSIQNIIQKEGYKTYTFEVKKISSDGASFLGDYYQINIKGKTEDGENETNIFMKSRKQGSTKIATTVNTPQAYAVEAFTYNELFKIFTKLQDDAGIPEKHRYRIIKSYDESNCNALFLENMELKGYESCHRTDLATLGIAEKALTEIAKFHALSYVVEKQMPEYFKNKIKPIESLYIFNKNFKVKGENFARVALEHLNCESRKRLELFLRNYSRRRQFHLQDRTARSSLCHGDYKIANLLLKYSGKEVTDIIIVDYQVLHYGSPINDITCFIFTSTDKQFRKQHLNYLKDLYYETFSGFLDEFHLKVDDIYPREDFEIDFKDRLDYGLICALFFLPIYLTEEESSIDFGGQSDNKLKMLSSYTERIQGLVDDFVSYEVL